MSRFLAFASRALAEARSRAAWDDIRPAAARSPDDVTTMLWPVQETEGGGAVVEVPDADAGGLTRAERLRLAATFVRRRDARAAAADAKTDVATTDKPVT